MLRVEGYWALQLKMKQIRGGTLRKGHLGKDLKDAREGAMWISGGKLFQGERTASANALGQKDPQVV